MELPHQKNVVIESISKFLEMEFTYFNLSILSGKLCDKASECKGWTWGTASNMPPYAKRCHLKYDLSGEKGAAKFIRYAL